MNESDETNEIMLGLKKTLDNWKPVPSKSGSFLKDEKIPKYWGIPTVIRILLSAGIIYMVFREAGPWTSFFAFLMLVQSEAQYYMNAIFKYKLTSMGRVQVTDKQSAQDREDKLKDWARE